MRKVLAFVTFCCLLPLIAKAASFDCSANLNTIEKLICSSQSLSELDSTLALVYKNALKNTHDKEELKRNQRAWIKGIRDKCEKIECLNIVYKERIQVLQGSVVSTSTDPLADIEGTYLIQNPYCSQYDGEGKWDKCPPTTADCLSIKRISNDTAHVSVESYQTNGHLCSASGIARITTLETLEIIEADKYYPDVSKQHVVIQLSSNPMKLQGPSEACGARASWTFASFPKKLRNPEKMFECSDYQNPDRYLPDPKKK
jgi:uncharacterized protein